MEHIVISQYYASHFTIDDKANTNCTQLIFLIAQIDDEDVYLLLHTHI